MKHIIGIVGTNSKRSTNRQLLQFIQHHFKDKAHIELLEIDQFPLFNKPASKKLPEIVWQAANLLERADGVIISAAEYNHAITASLANALHWLSYYISPLKNKPVMITGASYGKLGSSRAQVQLRQILDSADIKARVLPNSEFLLGNSLQAFDQEGKIVDPDRINALESIFEEFIKFIDYTQAFLNENQKSSLKISESLKEE
ncbi:NADPH-dependent FMN reductase [Facklamia hominis]|uniref:NADPH-dependent FMN reductase n=1 Tax=Facklamia hominis TaxID=178214 RepID=UPI000353C7EA|nr:NADPH-dependent FMN reductase [Facklamia hominis]EPH11787.1 hypothetical protein HMPREF9260_00882 [Facklamia hominis ACS-120-V-Sch10]PKY92329.1 NAD(P)H-dependent oxidoreductase [Facklamia hominis]